MVKKEQNMQYQLEKAGRTIEELSQKSETNNDQLQAAKLSEQKLRKCVN